jgi:integrase/recombinase XerD
MPITNEDLSINARSYFGPAIKAWEIYLPDQGKSVHTVKAFCADLRLLASYLPVDQSLGSITASDINNFLAWMQNERGVACSPKTLARRITSIKAFFRWLQTNGAILGNPAEKVIQRSVLSPLPNVLKRSEMDHILGIADRKASNDPADYRYSVLAMLLLASGIKKGECINLTINHVDLSSPAGAILFVRYANPKHRYKERKIKLSERWVKAFSSYKEKYDLSERLFPWSQRRLEYLLEDLGREANLEHQLSFLMCRWTSALNDMEDGMERDKIRQKMGVSEIQWRELEMKLERLLGERENAQFE